MEINKNNTNILSYSFRAMEALWKLEDKWKLTTQEAFLLLGGAAFAVIGLCAATMLKRKAQRNNPRVTMGQDRCTHDSIRRSDPESDRITIRKVLMGSARWSGAHKWDDESVGSWREKAPIRLLGSERFEPNLGPPSHNSVSPVWQRPILMGEKCELLRFSGLILYDERGRLLDHSLTSPRNQHVGQGIPATAALRTTLRDLL